VSLWLLPPRVPKQLRLLGPGCDCGAVETSAKLYSQVRRPPGEARGPSHRACRAVPAFAFPPINRRKADGVIMPAVEAAGAALLTFGPVVTFFLGFVAPRSQLLIMSVLAAFFWVLAISLTGLVWVVIPPLQAYAGFFLPLAVLLQVRLARAPLGSLLRHSVLGWHVNRAACAPRGRSLGRRPRFLAELDGAARPRPGRAPLAQRPRFPRGDESTDSVHLCPPLWPVRSPQELARWGLAKLHLRAEPFVLSLLPAADPMAWNDLSVALAAGTGEG